MARVILGKLLNFSGAVETGPRNSFAVLPRGINRAALGRCRHRRELSKALRSWCFSEMLLSQLLLPLQGFYLL